MFPALATAALAREVVLRNDTAYDDAFDASDYVAWLAYPECAAVVLDPAPEDYPLDIHTILIFLGSSQGNQDHAITYLYMGIDLLEEGEEVTLPGYSEWALPEAPYQVTVSSTYLNAISLDDPAAGLFPLTVESGDVAVWVCAPDPADTYYPDEWPQGGSAADTSGLVIDSGSPSGGSWLSASDGVHNLTEYGAEGSLVIRAVSGYPDPLALSTVTPAGTDLGVAADITLSGAGFDDTVSATIGGLPIGEPVLVDDTTATGRSPSGLPVGEHDVMVTNSAGESALLPSAFAVRERATPDTAEDTEGQDDEDEGCGCQSRPGGVAWGGVAVAWIVSRVRGHR